MSGTIQQVVLKQHIEGQPQESHFELSSGELPEPGQGQISGAVRYLSLDPYLRGVLSGRHMGHTPVQVGDLVPGRGIVEVTASSSEGIHVGDHVVAETGWQSQCTIDGASARKLAPSSVPLSLHLGILGMPGLTAYAGLKRMARPQAGETLVVSAASGPVGSMVGQIGLLNGCRVVGIAGGPEKCQFVKQDLGFHHCIDYKSEELTPALKEACPDGIDIYFDNVAGETLDAVFNNLALNSRIILCGMITQYNASKTPDGPNLGRVIGARGTMHGLVVYDHYDLRDEFLQRAGTWLSEGRLRYREDVAQGLENAPEAFCRLMAGKNFGKALVAL